MPARSANQLEDASCCFFVATLVEYMATGTITAIVVRNINRKLRMSMDAVSIIHSCLQPLLQLHVQRRSVGRKWRVYCRLCPFSFSLRHLKFSHCPPLRCIKENKMRFCYNSFSGWPRLTGRTFAIMALLDECTTRVYVAPLLTLGTIAVSAISNVMSLSLIHI